MRIILAALTGAVVAFLWTAVSWMALPWHNLDFHSFKDDQVVAKVLLDEVQEDGVYVEPNLPGMQASPDQRLQWQRAVAQGPYAYLAIRAHGTNWSMGMALLIQFACQVAIGLILAWILSLAGAPGALKAGLIAALAVVCGALYEDLRYWNWWGFPGTTTVVNVADLFITWFLGGLAMGRVLRGRKETVKE